MKRYYKRRNNYGIDEVVVHTCANCESELLLGETVLYFELDSVYYCDTDCLFQDLKIKEVDLDNDY